MSQEKEAFTSSKKQGPKCLEPCVHLLDSTSQKFRLSSRALGQELYELVVDSLQLVEYDYFDLEYVNKDGVTCWLDHSKPLQKQTTGPNKEYVYTFSVKFYTPHPNLLEDEYTRYLFALQIKKDLHEGRIQCNENTSALLAAFIVQARIGDFLEDVYLDHSYLKGLQLMPATTPEFLRKVAECHRNLIGQSPADADCNLLDTVRKVELYGIRMHPTKDNAGLKVNLAVAHSGILVYQGNSKINTFSWARIRKLSFKRKRFYIKLHPESFHAAEFAFEARDECKSFWKQCIEHHAFFRCQAVRKTGNRRSRMVTKGSTFRYTGRTQKQLIDYVRENYVKMPPFERSSSAGRVLTVPLPTTILTANNTEASGIRVETGVHSDVGPVTTTLIRPQTDPAQRMHLTDSNLSPDATRSLTVAIPLREERASTDGGYPTVLCAAGQLVRQRRSCSVANDVALNSTLPRGAYLISAMGTASSGSYTMNSSLSAGSPAASNSSAGSPQPDRKTPTVPDYPAHFILPSQLRMQDLALRPLSVASLGPISTLAPANSQANQISWRSSLPRPTSPTPSGILLTQAHGPGSRPVGVAVLPTDPYSSMHASLLMTSQNSAFVTPAVSQLGGAVPVLTLGSTAANTRGPSPNTSPMRNVVALSSPVRTVSPVTSGAAVGAGPQPRTQPSQYVRLPTDPNLFSQQLKLPPGYALLTSSTAAGPGGNRIIYIDRNTGRPLLPIITASGQVLLDNAVPITWRQSPVPAGAAMISSSIPQTAVRMSGQSHPPTTASSGAPATIPRVLVAATCAPSQTAPAEVQSNSLGRSPVREQGTASAQNLVVNGVHLRPRRSGPPPPAPERRDSMLSRPASTDIQHYPPEGDQEKSQKITRLPEIPIDKAAMLDSGGEDEASESLQQSQTSPKRQHPLAMGLITGPNGAHSASCLSLAARGKSALSTRSLCTQAQDGGSEDANDDDDDYDEGAREDDDDDYRSVCSQRSTLRSRSVPGRQRTCHHHHRRPQPLRCQSAVDPSMGSTNSLVKPSTPRASGELQANNTEHTSATHRTSHSNRRASRHHTDGAYHLICDLVMTERTYGRDLSVVCVCFRQNVTSLDDDSSVEEDPSSRLGDRLATKLFDILDPIYMEHQKILASLESRLESWSSRSNKKLPLTSAAQSTETVTTTASGSASSMNGNGTSSQTEQPPLVYRIGDLFVSNLQFISYYQRYLAEVEQVMLEIESEVRHHPALEDTIRNFEAQRVCYLPFYVFLLKPMHRLLQYRVSMERLMRHYGEAHPDSPDCRVVHARLLDLIQSRWECYKRLENSYKLLEVQRDLIGLTAFPVPLGSLPNADESRGQPVPSSQTSSLAKGKGVTTESNLYGAGPLLRPGRQFIREGWLQKLSKKGYQPRMFFLFSDQLVYASRTSAPYLQFKVHGQFPLHDLMVEEVEPAHSFTVFSGNRCFLVAAPSDWQRDRWLEDISRAILAAKTKPSFSSPSSSSEATKMLGPSDGMNGTSIRQDDSASSASTTTPDPSQMLQRATTSVHVCWHRCFTFSMQDILRANEYQTSGYLLRKFKNSNGWQRLWVVFTQNCLFFYKSYRDDCPLASLPLLGYTIATPDPDDQIRRDNVIKLQFKNHVYFFRGETHHSFERWFEYLSCAAGTSRRSKI